MLSASRPSLESARRKLRERINNERRQRPAPSTHRERAAAWIRRNGLLMASGTMLALIGAFLRLDVQAERMGNGLSIGAAASIDSVFSVAIQGQDQAAEEQPRAWEEDTGEKPEPQPQVKKPGRQGSIGSTAAQASEGCQVEVLFRGITLVDAVRERPMLLGARMGREWAVLRSAGADLVPVAGLSHEEWLEAYQGDYFDLDAAARSTLVPAAEAAVKASDLYTLRRIRVRLEDGKPFAQVIGLLDDALRKRIAEAGAGPKDLVKLTFSRTVAGKLDLTVDKIERSKP